MIMSKIIIRNLRPEDKDLIKDLDPFGRSELLSLPVGFGLCALSKEGDALFLAGVVIGTVSKKSIYIEWMAVDPDRQFGQIGEELLAAVFNLAVSMDMKNVHAMIHEDYLRKGFSSGGDSFFMDHLFEREDEVGDDIFVDLKTLSKNSYLKKPVDLAGFIALSDMKRQDREACILKLSKKKGTVCAADIMSIKSFIDYDLSLVYMEKNDIAAALLVYIAGDVLVPVYFFCQGDFLLRPLICGSFENAVAKYGKTKKVSITRRHNRSTEIVKKVLGDWGTMRMLTAFVADYKEILKDG